MVNNDEQRLADSGYNDEEQYFRAPKGSNNY